MDTHERTALATAVCLALVVAAFVVLTTAFEWPTSRLDRSPSEREIVVYDIIPEIAAGYMIGLGAIAITRFMFPKSNIRVILYVAVAGATLFSLALMKLSAAIGGPTNPRDLGGVVTLFAVPLAVGTWAVASWLRSKGEAR